MNKPEDKAGDADQQVTVNLTRIRPAYQKPAVSMVNKVRNALQTCECECDEQVGAGAGSGIALR